MKKIIFFSFIFIAISCTSDKKSTWDMGVESFNTGKRIDSIVNNVHFGMNESELLKAIEWNMLSGSYKFNTDVLNKYKFEVKPYYFNDSLYNLCFILMDKFLSEYSDFKPICSIYEIKYGIPDTIINEKDKIDYYWFNGNLELNINFHKTEYYNFITIQYLDLERKIFSYKNRDNIIHGSDNDFGDMWTKDYYENVYLPKRKEESDGI